MAVQDKKIRIYNLTVTEMNGDNMQAAGYVLIAFRYSAFKYYINKIANK